MARLADRLRKAESATVVVARCLCEPPVDGDRELTALLECGQLEAGPADLPPKGQYSDPLEWLDALVDMSNMVSG